MVMSDDCLVQVHVHRMGDRVGGGGCGSYSGDERDNL